MKIDLPFTIVSTLVAAVIAPELKYFFPETFSSVDRLYLTIGGAIAGMAVSLLLMPYSKENKDK